MAKRRTKPEVVIVDGPLDAGKPSKPKYRMAKRNGEWVKVRIVDADSPTFAADFQAAFRWNVRRIRRQQRATSSQETE